MADFTSLKQTIQSYIKQNGNEEISGNILQDVLLAMVSTMGDGAINTLSQALQNEITARGNADTTLQGNIDREATARGNADTALGGRIDGLQTTVNTINTKLAEGYVYAGIATAATNPGTPTGKVFYLALDAGTYTNFVDSGSSALVLTYGINILKYNGTSWAQEQLIGIDEVLLAGSNNLAESGAIFKEINKDAEYYKTNPIEFTDGYYIPISEQIPSPVSNVNFRYAKIACLEGDMFTLNVQSEVFAGVYGFYNANGQMIMRESATGTYNNLVVVAPAGSSWLLINDFSKEKRSYYGLYLKTDVADFKQLETLYNKDNGAYQTLDYEIAGAGYVNTNGSVISSWVYFHTSPVTVPANKKLVVITAASSGTAAISTLNENNGNLTNIVTGTDGNILAIYKVDAVPYDRKIVVTCRENFKPYIILSDDDERVYEHLQSKENFIYKDIVKIEKYGDGYYDVSGVYHDLATYKLYHLILNAGDSVMFNFAATETVAAVAMFNSDFSTMQSVLKAGNNGSAFSDFKYTAVEKTYICVSSSIGLDVKYINRGDIARFEVTEWVADKYLQEYSVAGTYHTEYYVGIVGNANYHYTRLIPVRRGDILYVKNLFINKNTVSAGLYLGNDYIMDLTKGLKQSEPYTADFQWVCEYPLSYVRVCSNLASNCQVFIVETGHDGRTITHPSHLDGKKLNIIGDSYIAAEADQNQYNSIWYHWAGLIAQEHNMTYRNYGKGGMATNWVIEHIADMDAVADYAGVVVGKNDYNNQVPLNTFRQNVNTIIDLLIDKYIEGGTKLFFGTPWRVSEETEAAVGAPTLAIPLQDYVDIIVEECAKRSFPCFDASRKSGVFCESAKFRATFMMGPNDISHMNPKGFAYVKPKWESFLESL